jgi:hydroxypyruvate reductase/glycerate 2-kinase
MNHRYIAEQIFLAGINSVLPERLITGMVALKSETLSIGHLNFSLQSLRNIYVIGAGKASAAMGAEVEKILGDRIAGGHIVVKYGHSCRLKYINVTEAGHPVPDSNGYKATEEILKIAGKADRNDLVICLLSGGGSALLADFPEGSSPGEIAIVNNLLINCGASIQEINAVRKHLSRIKGGQLARAVSPATIVSLILSDVAGDPLDVIASGPTTPDPSTFKQALDVLEKYKLDKSFPPGVLKYLNDGNNGLRPETVKPSDPVLVNTHNILAGNNILALEAAKEKALEFNINAVIIDNQLQGDTASVAKNVVAESLKFQRDNNVVKPLCLLFGGETTIRMTGSGLGGRNQHLALLSAILLQNNRGITILSAGTDGTDGPTDAAGAVVDSDTATDALSKKADPAKYIQEFDSYHFFKKAGGHIITGPTKTNVMDIIVALVR